MQHQPTVFHAALIVYVPILKCCALQPRTPRPEALVPVELKCLVSQLTRIQSFSSDFHHERPF